MPQSYVTIKREWLGHGIPFTTTPPYRYTYNSRIVRCEYNEGNSTSTDSSKDTSEARVKDRAWQWQGTRHEARTTARKERMKNNETRTNKRIKKEQKQAINR